MLLEVGAEIKILYIAFNDFNEPGFHGGV